MLKVRDCLGLLLANAEEMRSRLKSNKDEFGSGTMADVCEHLAEVKRAVEEVDEGGRM